MNWDVIKGKWKQLKGEARKQWGKLTDDDWEQVGGEKDTVARKDTLGGLPDIPRSRKGVEFVEELGPRDAAHELGESRRCPGSLKIESLECLPFVGFRVDEVPV